MLNVILLRDDGLLNCHITDKCKAHMKKVERPLTAVYVERGADKCYQNAIRTILKTTTECGHVYSTR